MPKKIKKCSLASINIIKMRASILFIVVTILGLAHDAKSNEPCSDFVDLETRVVRSLTSKKEELNNLRGVLDDVISQDECHYLVNEINPDTFVSSLGYEDGSIYNAPVGYSGLDLKQLASKKSYSHNGEEYYQRLLQIRERLRVETERALQMCPNTLYVHYTQLAVKTEGGKHTAHADNCFYTIKDGIESCDTSKEHPWPMRAAASILFLNDNFGGGEFYWADPRNGLPERRIQPKPGRMTYFTSGVENLHGALPVEELQQESCSTSPDTNQTFPTRRIVLAMWYTTSPNEAESVPTFGKEENDEDQGHLIFEIKIKSVKRGGLLRTLYFWGRQHMLWTTDQPNDNMLTMLFKDHSAMLSISIKGDSIVVSRHVDFTNSLQYQLQEAVLLHKLLDDLQALATSAEVRQEDRLLTLENMNAIDTCREALQAKPA